MPLFLQRLPFDTKAGEFFFSNKWIIYSSMGFRRRVDEHISVFTILAVTVFINIARHSMPFILGVNSLLLFLF